jgi:hypothetical protein
MVARSGPFLKVLAQGKQRGRLVINSYDLENPSRGDIPCTVAPGTALLGYLMQYSTHPRV